MAYVALSTRRQQTSVVSDSLKMGLGLNRRLAYVAFSTPRKEGNCVSDALKMGLGLSCHCEECEARRNNLRT